MVEPDISLSALLVVLAEALGRYAAGGVAVTPAETLRLARLVSSLTDLALDMERTLQAAGLADVRLGPCLVSDDLARVIPIGRSAGSC